MGFLSNRVGAVVAAAGETRAEEVTISIDGVARDVCMRLSFWIEENAETKGARIGLDYVAHVPRVRQQLLIRSPCLRPAEINHSRREERVRRSRADRGAGLLGGATRLRGSSAIIAD